MVRLSWLALAVLATLAAGPELFDYRRDAPVDLRETQPEVRVRDVTFASVSGGRTSAFLVEPKRPGGAAVLWVHWYEGGSPTSNRTQFLGDAIALGGDGVVSLLIETMWSPARWFLDRNPADDFSSSVRQVKELRRALDVLMAQRGVDRRRVVYAGHDFGAMYGVLMASVDPRPAAWVLMAGTPLFSDWFLLAPQRKGAERQKVIDDLAPLGPLQHTARISPAPVLFQFARKDRFVPEEQAKRFHDAAGEPKKVLWYDGGHELSEQASKDRLAWLREQLKLSSR
jgi:dienelactone hydrolase